MNFLYFQCFSRRLADKYELISIYVLDCMETVTVLVEIRAFFFNTHASSIRSATATVDIDVRRRGVRPRIQKK